MNQNKIRSVLFLTLGIFVLLFFHFIPIGFDDGGDVKTYKTETKTNSQAESRATFAFAERHIQQPDER